LAGSRIHPVARLLKQDWGLILLLLWLLFVLTWAS